MLQKKIREKYKKIRQNKKVAVSEQPTEPEKTTIFEPASAQSKVSTIKTANKIKDKYLKIRKNKNSQNIPDHRKKDKLLNATSTAENVKNSSDKKRKSITAQKIVKKYKNPKKPKRTYLVDEKDIKTPDYNSTDEEDLYAGEGIVNVANKVFDYNKFKKDGNFAGQSIVNAANKILSEDIAGPSK